MADINTLPGGVKGSRAETLTFNEAFQGIHYGDIPHARTQDARYGSLDYCDDWADLPFTTAPYFFDARSYVKDKCGEYDTSQPFTIESGKVALDKRVEQSKREGYLLDRDRINPGRSGLGARDVAGIIVSIMECDDKTVTEQIIQTDRFEAWAGRTVYSLGVLSGDTRPSARAAVERIHTTTHRIAIIPGKSLQLYVAHPVFIEPSTAHEIHKHQVALFGADACTANADRRMRRPSSIASRRTDDGAIEYRVQSTLRAEHTPITGDDYLVLLRGYAAHLGVDVEREYVEQVKTQRGIGGERGADFDGSLTDAGELAPSTKVRDADRVEMTLADLARTIPDKGRVDAFVRDNEGRPTAAVYRNGAFLSINDFSVLKHWWCNVGDVGVEDTSLHLVVDVVKTHTRESEIAIDVKELQGGPNPPGPNLSLYKKEEGQVGTSSKDDCKSLLITTLKRADLIDGRYLPRRRLTRRLTVNRAHKGRGKTELAAWLVSEVRAAGKHSLAAAHRRALVDSLATRCGLPHYRGHHPLTYQPVDPRDGGDLAITLDSIHKVPVVDADGRIVRYGLVFLDEVQQVLRHLFGGTLKGSQGLIAYNRLRDLLRNAERVVVADADFDRLSLDALMDMMGIDEGDVEIVSVDEPSPWTYKVTGSRYLWLNKAVAAWVAGKRLALAIQSRRMAHAIALLMEELQPERRVLLVSQTTVVKIEQEAGKGNVANWINRNITKYGAIIYTPTIGTGYSIDVTGHFDEIFGLGFGQVGPAQDLAQMLHRVRNPASATIHVCASPQGTNYPRKAATIRKGLLSLTLSTIALAERGALMEIGSVSMVDGKPSFTPHNPAYFELYCRVTAYSRSWGGPMGVSQLGALQRHLQGERATVIPWDKETEEEALDSQRIRYNACKAAYLRARARDVASADLLDEMFSEADFEPSTPEEALSLERTVVDRFYGESTEDTVYRDDEGRHRSVCRRYGKLRLLTEQPETLKNMDWWDARSGALPAMGHHEARTQIVFKLMERFGIDPKALIEAASKGLDYTWMTPDTEDLRDYLASRQATLARCDVHFPRDWQKNPRRFFSDLITNYFRGVGLDKAKVRREGGRAYAYTLAGDELAALHRDSAKWVDDKLASVGGEPAPMIGILADIDDGGPVVVIECEETQSKMIVKPEPTPEPIEPTIEEEPWTTAEGIVIHRLHAPVIVPDGSIMLVSFDERRGCYLGSGGIPVYVLPFGEAGHSMLRHIERVKEHGIDDPSLLPYWQRFIDQRRGSDPVWNEAGRVLGEVMGA